MMNTSEIMVVEDESTVSNDLENISKRLGYTVPAVVSTGPEIIRILLVEDNAGDARMIQELLTEVQTNHFELESTNHLWKGLEFLASGDMDVVLLDLSLPDSQGLDTFTRAYERAPQMPIIVLTGFDDEGLAVQAVRNGAQDYLVKGHVDSNMLVRAIRYAIERKRAEEALQKAHADLERRVEERTAELSKANGLLAQEVTERKLVEERQTQLLKEVESANQQLRDFAYIVSHDLKAPLRGIGSMADWIANDYEHKFDEEGKELLNLLTSRVTRLYYLIDGILRYLKVGRIKEEKVEVNLNQLVTEVINMIAPPENIEIEFENQLPPIICQKTPIQQVFQNLISNAVKYMDKPKGKIKIGCTAENGYWKFSVADNGPGIAEKYFAKIFRIFQTLAPRDEFESTGVGLALVKKIAEMYGGEISVESKVGSGSTFIFTLPK